MIVQYIGGEKRPYVYNFTVVRSGMTASNSADLTIGGTMKIHSYV